MCLVNDQNYNVPLCDILADYSKECAKNGKIVNWRLNSTVLKECRKLNFIFSFFEKSFFSPFPFCLNFLFKLFHVAIFIYFIFI